jgi:hypothetical protein
LGRGISILIILALRFRPRDALGFHSRSIAETEHGLQGRPGLALSEIGSSVFVGDLWMESDEAT